MKVDPHHQRHQSQVVLGQTASVNPRVAGGVLVALVVPLGECTSERVTEVAWTYYQTTVEMISTDVRTCGAVAMTMARVAEKV